VSYRQIIVDGTPAGLRGLEEIFADLRAMGRLPGEPGLGAEIVALAEAHNYIPPTAQEAFAATFVREYAVYLDQQGEGRRRDYGTWRGYPREQIPWFPTVNEDLCDGCALCLRLCRTHALGGGEDGRVRVEDPFACVVGCSSCANVCKPGAITFPPRTLLDAYKTFPKSK